MPGTLHIAYESEDFPTGATVTNGEATLQTSWNEILWAAITVGRPNRHYVFRHGSASQYEALFRWSLIRMAIEQHGSTRLRLQRTDAAKSLDPSEKGAVNYFLGMTMCKLFAARRLGAPWMLHLDVFRPQLNPVLNGRSRPDLVGQTTSGEWIGMESKGRISEPGPVAKQKAKDQAERLVSVSGVAPILNIGAITFFRSDVLRFYWCDPTPNERGKSIRVDATEDMWRSYYAPAFELVRSRGIATQEDVSQVFPPERVADVDVSIDPAVSDFIAREDWTGVRRICLERASELKREGYQPDGIRVIAGESWTKPFIDTFEQ
jgi:hypothetical protein